MNRSLFAAVVVALVSVLGARGDEPAPERWYGTLDAKVARLRLLIEVQRDDKGVMTGTLTSLDQNNAKLVVDTISITDGVLRLDIKQVAASFEGRLNEQRTMADGTWSQSGQSFPLTLSRVDEVPEDKLIEAWVGVLKVGARTLQLQFRVLERGDQRTVLCDSLSEGARSLTATMDVDGHTMTFKVPAIRG
jgi:hypothetical protein